MVKKITLIFISLVILIAGIIAFNNLHYWERSVRIFKMNSEQTEGRSFERRGSHERFEREQGARERPDFRNMPDSVRQRIIAERGFQSSSDSLRQRSSRTFSGEREALEGRGFDRGGHRGGNFRRGRNVNLGDVSLFFAVFAAFTVVTIYIDKVLNIIRKREKRIAQNTQ